MRTVSRHGWRRLWRFLVFPLAAWSIWRVAQGLIVWFWGGDPVSVVMQWDGGWYEWILDHGYEYRPDMGVQQPIAFFPFVSWVTWLAEFAVGRRAVAIGIVTLVGSAASVVAVYGCARAWRGERVARWAVVFMLVFPVSFFLWSFYTEAIFIAASAGAFWAHRRGNHGIAAVLAAIAAMTRVFGLLVGVILIGLRLFGDKRPDRVAVWYLLGALAFIPVLVVQWIQWGDPFAFVGAQYGWGRELSAPWVPVRTHLGWVPHTGIGEYRWAALLDLVLFATALFCALYAAYPRRRRRERNWPPESWIWILVMILPPLFTTIFVSMSRFTLAAWPMFVVLAVLAVRVHPVFRIAVLAVSGVVSVVLLEWVARGIYIA